MDVLERQIRGMIIMLDELRQIPRYNAEAERRLRQLRRRRYPATAPGAAPGDMRGDLQEDR
jgi:hypothetical protein